MPEIAGAKLSIDPRLLPRTPGARVIDVGCGDGRHVAAAARTGARAVGVDYDIREVRRARASCNGLRIDFVAADATRLPFRDAAFNAAICTETLEHVPADRSAIAELARVLRDGAPLLGAVPSHFTELVYWRLSRGYRDAPGGHVRIYAPPVLARRVAEAGFALESIRFLHFVDSLFWLRYCLADAFFRKRARSPFEQAVALAVAEQAAVPSWRRRVRAAFPRSRFIAAIDAAGAFVWPKSFAFVARRTARAPESSSDRR